MIYSAFGARAAPLKQSGAVSATQSGLVYSIRRFADCAPVQIVAFVNPDAAREVLQGA